MSNATLFLSDLSCVDHAYINDKGNVVGGSYNPSFLVHGKVDAHESVVVDFSTIKKDIKDIIDDKETGFDHKLWIIEGYSNCSYKIDGSNCTITTPTTTLSQPINSVKIFGGTEYEVGAIGREFASQVTRDLQIKYPNVQITASCNNNVNNHIPFSVGLVKCGSFSYVHGLKDSTSWGCQNISHGHLSYVAIQYDDKEAPTFKLVNECELGDVAAVCADIDNAVFINTANIISDSDNIVAIAYTTPRGRFCAEYKKSAYNIIYLETETTVEHLIEYVLARHGDRLHNTGARMLYVSEGLTKGACISLATDFPK